MSDYDTKRSELLDRAQESPMTVTELAGRIGVSRPYLSQVLHGHFTSAPALDKLESLLDRVESQTE